MDLFFDLFMISGSRSENKKHCVKNAVGRHSANTENEKHCVKNVVEMSCVKMNGVKQREISNMKVIVCRVL